MPLLSSRASGSVRAFGLTILSALTSVIDLFTRADQSGLGTIKGQRWRVWRGVWSIVSNKASSSSAAGDNALATLKFTKTDVTVSISGADPGMGAAFWVTDANNWYASVYTQNEACQTCFGCNSFSGGNCNAPVSGTCNSPATGNCAGGSSCCPPGLTPGSCYAFNPTSCIGGWTPGNCNVFNSANTGNRNPPFGFCFGPSRNPESCNNGFNPVNCLPGATFAPTCNNGQCCPGPFNTWSPYCAGNFNPPTCSTAPGSTNPIVCNALFTFACNCVTENRISILRSLSSTVSTISSSLFSSTIQSFRTILSGNQATIQAFSTTTYTSQIGNSVAENLTSPIKNTQHGIIKSTSSLNQGSSIDEFGVS